MNIGRFSIEQLSEGIFEVVDDGVFHKLEASEITRNKPIDEHSSFIHTLGIDPILIRSGKQVILLDTGLGWGLDHGSMYTETSNLVTNLDIFGFKPEDVTHVVLSHLHFDHAAGSTFVDKLNSTQATLPNAHYFVQHLEWLYAAEQSSENPNGAHAGYQMDELYKLFAEDRLVLIKDRYFELIKGIELIHTGGHTPGHQIVKIQDNGETAYYLGDLVPSELHLNNYFMNQVDAEPLQAKKAKTILLKQAYEEKAMLIFYHSIHTKAGILMKDEYRNYILDSLKDSY